MIMATESICRLLLAPASGRDSATDRVPVRQTAERANDVFRANIYCYGFVTEQSSRYRVPWLVEALTASTCGASVSPEVCTNPVVDM